MGKPKGRKKGAKRQPPPVNLPPAAPRVVGLDRVELRVKKPASSAALYLAIGFEPRTTIGRNPRVAVGGLELLLKRRGETDGQSNGTPPVAIQLAVDDVDKMRQRLTALELKPGGLKRLDRGDRYFQWRDPDGVLFRFVGPARRPDDRSIGDD